MAKYKFELEVETLPDTYLNEREFRQYIMDIIGDASVGDGDFPITGAAMSYVEGE